jgi:LCP family protein required for cell wall assembly
MTQFRFTQKPKKPLNSVDGFILKDQQIKRDDVRVRFRQNYSPLQNSPQPVPKPQERHNNDGFLPRNGAKQDTFTRHEEVNSHTESFNLQLDDEVKPPKKRRFLFWKKPKEKKKRSLRRRVLKSVGLVMLLAILGAGAIFGYALIKERQIFRGSGDGAAGLEKNVDPSRLNGEGDGRVNILLLGKGGPGHEAPDLTDTILLASIDPVQNEAALVSVPRDLYVEDANGYQTKINAIYSNAKQARLAKATSQSDSEKQAAEDAGLKAIKENISKVLGVPVHYYVMVDFTAFKESIDTVGGISIDVKEPLYDATMAWMNGGSSLIADKGMQDFNGTRALMYARSRYRNARDDFDRSERQKQVIFALQQKVLTLGTFSNPFKIVELLNTLGDNVRTDLEGKGTLKRLYDIAQQITADKFISVSLADPTNLLVTTAFMDGQSVVMPVAGLNEYDAIQSYVRNTLRDSFLKSENARVVILNGTATPGLASFREKELKSYGYNIVDIDNAPTNDYVSSRFIDLTNGAKPYTASYLEKRLNLKRETVTIEGLPTTETADFVIILGTDEASQTTTN